MKKLICAAALFLLSCSTSHADGTVAWPPAPCEKGKEAPICSNPDGSLVYRQVGTVTGLPVALPNLCKTGEYRCTTKTQVRITILATPDTTTSPNQ